jgi:hypothetical protein
VKHRCPAIQIEKDRMIAKSIIANPVQLFPKQIHPIMKLISMQILQEHGTAP